MLKVEDLACGYGARNILLSVGFEVSRGAFYGVIGPNGSGKTTLLRALSGIIKPTAGRIVLDGRDLGTIPRRILAQTVGVVSQLLPLAHMTVEEFVLLGRIPHFKDMQFWESTHDLKLAHRCMELTDTLRLKDKPLAHLSGGERQLAQIARAMAQEPKILLLDEPTAHLDISHQVTVMDLLRKLVRETGLTVVMVLHDLNLASEYCDRLTLVSEGRIFKTGVPGEVIHYGIIEKVYKTVVVVKESPISSKPHVFIVPGEELVKNQKL